MLKQFDIVGFGICAVDYLGLVSQYPKAGQKIPMEAYSKQGGGNTGTALTTASRLGAKTAYIGQFGRDEYSSFLLDEFEKEGVDFQHVIFQDGCQPPISFIHVDKKTGERHIARYWSEFMINPNNLDRAIIEDCKILFLDHYYTEAGISAAKWSKESCGTIVVDAERLTSGFDAILKLADTIIASNTFSSEQTGVSDPEKGAKFLQEKFGSVVVVTAGEKGAFCNTEDDTLYQPSFHVQVVDTTGAGDVFHGAFMVGLLKNWPLQKVLEFSAAVAALKCRGLGGRAMIPNRQEVLSYLRKNGKSKFWS